MTELFTHETTGGMIIIALYFLVTYIYAVFFYIQTGHWTTQSGDGPIIYPSWWIPPDENGDRPGPFCDTVCS